MDKNQYLIDIIEKQNINELKSFVKENSDFQLNFTTDNGSNLLHFSANKLSENTLSIIQILLEKGLDPMAVNENFVTPLEIAQQHSNVPAMTIMKHYINKRMQEAKNYS